MTRRTDKQIETSGDFVKIGKQHYRHESGREICYNCNTWRWEACGSNWPTMACAVFMVRREAQA